MAFSGQVPVEEFVADLLPRIAYVESALTLEEALFEPPEAVKRKEDNWQKMREATMDIMAQAIFELGGGRPQAQIPSGPEPRFYVSYQVVEELKKLATRSIYRFATHRRLLAGGYTEDFEGTWVAGILGGRSVLNTRGELSYVAYLFADPSCPETARQTEHDDVLGFVRIQDRANRVVPDTNLLNVALSPAQRRIAVYERASGRYLTVEPAVAVTAVELEDL